LLEAKLWLGRAYFRNEQFDDAESILQDVRGQMLKLWGWADRYSLICVTLLGKIFLSNNRLNEACRLYEEALTGVRYSLGSEHPWTSQLQNNIACFFIHKKDLPAAETYTTPLWSSLRTP
jgi:tetratricopeptide (TPR) repeat protein